MLETLVWAFTTTFTPLGSKNTTCVYQQVNCDRDRDRAKGHGHGHVLLKAPFAFALLIALRPKVV